MMNDQDIKKSGRARQRLWREKQKSEGKKVLTVTLSEEAKIILERQKERTGHTLSSIVDRALIDSLNLDSGLRLKNINNTETAKYGEESHASILNNLAGNGKNKMLNYVNFIWSFCCYPLLCALS